MIEIPINEELNVLITDTGIIILQTIWGETDITKTTLQELGKKIPRIIEEVESLDLPENESQKTT